MHNKKTFYFVRHGESEANAGGLRKGSETPLTPRGFKQAEFVAQRLAKLPVEVILSSSFVRTRQTSETIQNLVPQPIVYSDLLIERRAPSRGLGTHVDDPVWKGIFKSIDNNYGKFDWQFEDAESGGDLVKRAKDALDFILARPEQHIVVVTHGLFLRFLAAHILVKDALSGDAFSDFLEVLGVSNTGVSIFEYDETADRNSPWALRVWNDHAHLSELVKGELPEAVK